MLSKKAIQNWIIQYETKKNQRLSKYTKNKDPISMRKSKICVQ